MVETKIPTIDSRLVLSKVANKRSYLYEVRLPLIETPIEQSRSKVMNKIFNIFCRLRKSDLTLGLLTSSYFL